MIEPINETTYRLTMAEDEVEVGDITAAEFKPHAKLKRWGEECYLCVKPAGDITEVEVEVEEYKVKSKYKVKQNGFELELESEFYALSPSAQNELGSFELNIILAKKPPTNKLVFDIETQGLVFCYQPPLTQEEIDEGCERPDNVVGSYAVYHATKRDHILGQTNYMAGKAFHIYRPRIEDADGKWVWGVLDIDEQLGSLMVTIPQEFLDTANYPVRHAAGATFGYTSAGGSAIVSDDRIRASRYAGAAGTGTSMSVYGERDAETGIKAGLYKHSDGSFVKGTVEGTLPVTQNWVTMNFTENPTVEAVDYWLAAKIHDGVLYWDAGTIPYRYLATAYENAFPADMSGFTTSGNAYDVSIYCTYTPGGPPEAWLSGWDKRIEIDIDYTNKIGASVTWFPIAIIIESGLAGVGNKDVSSIFDELTTNDNRKKIAITKADGTTQLYCEIEQWDDAGENAALHISRDGWTIDADTSVFIYYDSAQGDNTTYVADSGSRNLGYYNGLPISVARYSIGAFFVDSDGHNAIKYPGNPIFSYGAAGKWDDWLVKDPCIVKVGSTYYLFYAGNGESGGDYSIGYATSTNGLDFTRQSVDNPILAGTATEWDEDGVKFPQVYYDSGAEEAKRWKMLYVGVASGVSQIGHAYAASPGGPWTKYVNNPVIPVGGVDAWDETSLNVCTLEKKDTTFYVYYSGNDDGAEVLKIGLATFTNWESIYSKYDGDGGPLIEGHPSATQQLTAQTNSGTKVVTVSDTSVFEEGEDWVVWLEDTTQGWGHLEQNRIASIDSGTQLTLVNNVARNYPINSWISSWISGGTVPRTVRYSNGLWQMWDTPFKALNIVIFTESNAYRTSTDGINWTLDTTQMPFLGSVDTGDGAWDAYSQENLSLLIDSRGRDLRVDPTNVWDANFMGVHHLTGAAYTDLDDSTANYNDITAEAGTPDYNTAAQVGKGVGFVADWDERIEMADNAVFESTDFTVELWLKSTNVTLAQYATARWSSPYHFQLGINPGGPSAPSKLVGSVYEGSTVYSAVDTENLVNGTWYHVVLVADNTNNIIRLYKDGAEVDNTATTGTYQTADGAVGIAIAGRFGNADNPFGGVLDEWRFSDTVRSAAWLKGTYNSGNDSLLTYGDEEEAPPEANIPAIMAHYRRMREA